MFPAVNIEQVTVYCFEDNDQKHFCIVKNLCWPVEWDLYLFRNIKFAVSLLASLKKKPWILTFPQLEETATRI